MKANTYEMPYGFMVVWDKIDAAARYLIHLSIGSFNNKDFSLTNKQEIECIEVDRNKTYYTFRDLAYLSKVERRWGQPDIPIDCKNYLVTIEAENKNGTIIDKIENVVGLIKYASTFDNGFMYATERNWRNK